MACVAALPGRLSRSTAAKVLVAAQVDEALAYAEHPMYGRLAGYGRKEVTGYVDALLADGRIAQDAQGRLVPAGRPVVSHEWPGQSTMTDLPPDLPPGIDLMPAGARERAAQVHALGEGQDPQAIPSLVAALEDTDGNVRRLAASALGKRRAADAVPALLRMLLAEPLPQVRQYAVKALGRLGDARANSTLARIAADPAEKDYVRAAARHALGGS
jgi:HEAT repeat protein